MVNQFLYEIDAKERTQFKENIYSARIAQADKKHYKDALNRIEHQERLARARRRRRWIKEGKTERERQCLERQFTHQSFSDLPEEEQSRLQAEINSMWAQIPEQARERARRLIGK